MAKVLKKRARRHSTVPVQEVESLEAAVAHHYIDLIAELGASRAARNGEAYFATLAALREVSRIGKITAEGDDIVLFEHRAV